MSDKELKRIADEADFIVNGYAFTSSECGVRVLNLHKPEHTAVLSRDGEVLETCMDDIELDIVLMYFKRNASFLTV